MAVTQATTLADFTSGIGTAGAVFQVDNENQRIGIGTTNPQSLLQVGDDIKMGGGIITATTFDGALSSFTGKFTSTGIGVSVSNGTASTATIAAPANLIIDPGVVGDDTGLVRIKGNLFVDGTTTQINSTTLEIADFVVGVASTATTDLLTDGAGIKIGPDNTFLYEHNGGTNSSLKSSENLNVASGKVYQIGETERLSADTLSVGTGATIHSPTSNVLTLGTNNTEKLRITSAGKIGIGTDNPVAKLEVVDSSSLGIISRSANTQATDTNKGLKVRNNSSTDTFNVSYKGQGYFAGKVGIGSEIPATKLDVAGQAHFKNNGSSVKIESSPGTNFTQLQLTNTGGNFYVGRENSAGSWFGTGSNYASVLRSDGAYPLIFKVNGENRLLITSDGLVGINSTSPATALDIQSTKNGDGLTITRAGTPSAFLGHNGSGNEGLLILREGGTNKIQLYAESGQNSFINTGGSVGIGTNNPVGNLEVRDTKANLIVAKDGLTVKSNSDLHTTYDLIQIGAGGALASYSVETATADTQFIHNAYRHSGGTYKYRYADSAARIRMNSPAGAIIFDNAASGSADGDITFAERLRIKSNGDVLMGGAGGNSYTGTNWGSGIPTFEFKGTSSSQPTRSGFIGFDSYSGTQGYAGIWSDNGSLQFYTGLTRTGSGAAEERLRITSAGQVSLGNNPTVASDTALHIELDGTREYLRLEGDGGGSNAYLEIEAPNNRRKAIIFKSGGTRRGVIGVGDSDEASATSLFLSASTNIAGNDPHMVITSAGNVGINRTDPDQKLNVNGCAEFNAYDGGNGTGGYYTSKGLIIGNAFDAGKTGTGDDRNAIIWQERGLDLVFATNDTSRMRINSAGLVGIGTDYPTNSHGKGLHVADTNAGIRIQNTADTGWAYMEYADESSTVKYIQGYRDVTGLYGIRPGNSLSSDSGITLDSSGDTTFYGNPSIDATDLYYVNSYNTSSWTANNWYTAVPNGLTGNCVYLVSLVWDYGGSGGSPYYLATQQLYSTNNGTNGNGTENEVTPMVNTHTGGTGCRIQCRTKAHAAASSEMQVSLNWSQSTSNFLKVKVWKMMFKTRT